MPEEHKKSKVQDRSEGKDIVFSTKTEVVLFQNVSTRVHWHAEERKSDGILTLNLATVITDAAYKLHAWAEMNL